MCRGLVTRRVSACSQIVCKSGTRAKESHEKIGEDVDLQKKYLLLVTIESLLKGARPFVRLWCRYVGGVELVPEPRVSGHLPGWCSLGGIELKHLFQKVCQQQSLLLWHHILLAKNI